MLRTRSRLLALLLVALASGGFAVGCGEDSIHPPEVLLLDVSDANTITVSVDGVTETVHLLGVRPPLGVRDLTADAAALIRSLLDGEAITLEYESAAPPSGVSRSAYVSRERDGLLINAEMLRQGFVVVYGEGGERGSHRRCVWSRRGGVGVGCHRAARRHPDGCLHAYDGRLHRTTQVAIRPPHKQHTRHLSDREGAGGGHRRGNSARSRRIHHEALQPVFAYPAPLRVDRSRAERDAPRFAVGLTIGDYGARVISDRTVDASGSGM